MLNLPLLAGKARRLRRFSVHHSKWKWHGRKSLPHQREQFITVDDCWSCRKIYCRDKSLEELVQWLIPVSSRVILRTDLGGSAKKGIRRWNDWRRWAWETRDYRKSAGLIAYQPTPRLIGSSSLPQPSRTFTEIRS